MTACPHCGGSGEAPDAGALRRWRESKRISLREMARRLGVSHVYLGTVERGKRAVSGRRLLELQAQYGRYWHG